MNWDRMMMQVLVLVPALYIMALVPFNLLGSL